MGRVEMPKTEHRTLLWGKEPVSETYNSSVWRPDGSLTRDTFLLPLLQHLLLLTLIGANVLQQAGDKHVSPHSKDDV